MWDKFRKENRLCEQYRGALEDLRPDVGQATASAELRNSLPAEVVEHARECDTCEEAAETFWASRDLLAGSLELARERHNAAMNETRPWFAAQGHGQDRGARIGRSKSADGMERGGREIGVQAGVGFRVAVVGGDHVVLRAERRPVEYSISTVESGSHSAILV